MFDAAFMSGLAHGALVGCLTAAIVDFQAFRSWKSFEEARQYSWGLALWRWFQGAVIGAVAGASAVVTF